MVAGALIIVVVSPAAALFVRRQPEDMGLRPDGDPPLVASAGSDAAQTEDPEYPWTVPQAVRTRAFWVLLGVGVLGFAGIPPVITHQVAFIQDKGLTLPPATGLATLFAGAAFAAKLPWGLLAERYAVRWFIPLCLVPAGLVVLVLILADQAAFLAAYAVIAGFSIGGFPTLSNLVWAEYFGRRHQGAIRGVVNPLTFAVPMAATVFAGWMWDRTVSYDLPFGLFALSLIAGGLLMLFAARPRVPVPVAGDEPAGGGRGRG